MKDEIVLFKDGELQLEVNIKDETVWLTQAQMVELFQTSRTNVVEHIKHIYEDGELEEKATCRNFRHVRKEGSREVTRELPFYNLDMIISVGYRVKSKRGIQFRQWATKVLKDYMIKGAAINEKRLQYLQKTVEITSGIIAGAFNIDTQDVLYVVNQYTQALELLDSYDHQCVIRPDGTSKYIAITEENCWNLINKMSFKGEFPLFGQEKEPGKLKGVLGNVFQNVFGTELYATAEEKAANLLYFIIKDHVFNDGCKRIGATLFLEFLNRNNLLFKDGKKIISDSALVAITLMVAESKAEDKEIIISLILNFLQMN